VARVLTVACEVGWGGTQNSSNEVLEGLREGTGTTPSIDTTTKRTGSGSWKFDSGAGNGTSNVDLQITSPFASYTNTNGFWIRGYFYFSNLPTTNARVLQSADGGALWAWAVLTTAGKLQLWDNGNGTPVQIGSDSSATISTGQWYRIELWADQIAGTGANAAELKLDGTSVASSSTATLDGGSGYGSTPRIKMGWVSAPGASKVCYVDDVAVNDSTGASQTSWPGDGKVVLLVPTSDNARDANWVAGAGGTTNLYDAVNNMPPTAVAVASATNTSQIKSLVNNATENYDANMTTYTAAGIDSYDTITLVQAITSVGCDSTTGPTFAAKIVSNPAQSTEDTRASDTVAVGSYNNNWIPWHGTAQYAPSVTVGTAPVLRVGRRTASATVTMTVAFMGIYVEYVDGSPPESDSPAVLRVTTTGMRW
jgi:hypothetical protein